MLSIGNMVASKMKLTRQDIRLFRTVSLGLCVISGVVIFLGKGIGYTMLALSLFFLFAPFKEGDDV